MSTLRLASYNVHRGIGHDRKCMPERILGVIEEIDPDVIALQEVEAHDCGGDMLAWLAQKAGYEAIAGTTIKRKLANSGTMIL